MPQPPQLLSTLHTAVSAAQAPPQPTSISSWAEQVATADQSGRSTPETVVPNWAYSGRIHGSRPRSQPLVYPQPVMPTPHIKRPLVPSPRFGSTIVLLRPQQPFPQPPPTIDPSRQTTTRVLTPYLGGVHEPQHTKYNQFVLQQYRLHSRLPVTQRALHEAHSRHLLAGDQTLLHQHTESHTGHRDQISDFTSLQTLSASIPYKVYMCQRGSTIFPTRPNTN